GGISGNSANALLQPLTDYLNPMRHGEIRQVLSMGFSTALFASVGALCALNISDMLGHQKRFAHLQQGRGKWWPVLLKRLVLPFAAGLALLGILGGGGEAKTDYAAHIWGFFCGLAVTFATLPLKRLVFTLPAGPQKKAQGLLAALTLALLCLCWLYALLN
ncbi:rhomboid family intramembrane serine protease, partial [Desulfovibrio sp. OttesenSCG-928-M16]|nr:rhomboid family intramembrane serine protease [Desulfovibrio sp. OttesenSCG-928-M16]